MKYYDHYILAQGGIHNITAFAVAFNFKFFSADSICQHSWFHAFSVLRLTHVVFLLLNVFMRSCHVSLCLLVGCTFTGLHGPRMVGIVGGPDSFSLVIPFRLRDGCFSGSLHFMGSAWLSIVHLLCVVT